MSPDTDTTATPAPALPTEAEILATLHAHAVWEESHQGLDPAVGAAWSAFHVAAEAAGGKYRGSGAYAFPQEEGEWIMWNGEWSFHPER
jgi:hypothetical protein